MYTLKVHVAWEHYSFKNVDLVAIQSSDPQAWIMNIQLTDFHQSMILSSEIFIGLYKIETER